MGEHDGPTGSPEADRLLTTAQQAGGEGRWADAEEALLGAADLLAATGAGAAEVRTRLQLAVLQASTGRVSTPPSPASNNA